MRISYDSEVDALYVRLPERDYQCRTVRLNDEIALNIAPGEHLAGIEILDARQVFWWQGVEVENLPLASGSG
jgi:uncharacterized protein YuzE